MRTNSSSSNERLKINQSSITPFPALAPSGHTPKPRRRALDVAASATPAPARKSGRQARDIAPQLASKGKLGIASPAPLAVSPAAYPDAATPTRTMIEGGPSETSPPSGAKPLKSRANGLPIPRPPAQQRAKPVAQFSDEQGQARILARYHQLLASMAGAFGLYLHGAATLPQPSIDDLTNIEEFTAMIRGFGLPSVGFDAP